MAALTDLAYWRFALTVVGVGSGLIVAANWWVWHIHQSPAPDWKVPWPLQTLRSVCVLWVGWVLVWLQLSGVLSTLVLGGIALNTTGAALSNLFGYLLGVVASGMVLLEALVWWPFRGQTAGLFDTRPFRGWWKWGVGGYLAVMPLIFIFGWLGVAARRTGGWALLNELTAAGSGWTTQAVVLLTVCAVAPAFEEVFFRGFVFTSLASRWGWIPGAIGSSLLFAAVHLRLDSLLPLFFLGIALSAVYHRTRSLAPSFLLHSLFNLGSFFALLVGAEV